MSANIAILSGEVSGDLVGGALAREITQIRPDIKLWGLGSRKMEEAGVDLLYNSASWSAIGVLESLKIYPALRFKMYPHVLREIGLRKPALVICIDFGAFNTKVTRWCKARGIPVFYYFPPGSWKRNGRINPEITALCAKIATPFPWSAQRYQEAGGNAEFVGHPLLELVQPTLSRLEFTDRFGLEPGKPIIGLLPGSRTFEIEHNTPAMIDAARIIHKRIPDTQFVIGLAPHVSQQVVTDWLRRSQDSPGHGRSGLESRAVGEIANVLSGLEDKLHLRTEPKLVTPEGVQVPARDVRKQEAAQKNKDLHLAGALPPLVIAKGLAHDVMAHSDALVVCSGTATLEAAILGTPMVIIYRGSKLMELEYRARRLNRISHIGLPNIIANARIVPELIQEDANAEEIAGHIAGFLTDPELRAATKSRLSAVRDALGDTGASRRTAILALETADLLPPRVTIN
jgi:lipid-A-disaccharide synthase